jgi:hypothetical protein
LRLDCLERADSKSNLKTLRQNKHIPAATMLFACFDSNYPR